MDTVIILKWILLSICISYARGQKNEGDSCVEEYAYTVGRCTPADKCKSAKENFQNGGIKPTFCTYSAFGLTLVCCSDGSNILHTATNTFDRLVLSSDDTKSVSERKCEEYSRAVVETVHFLPLGSDPDTHSITIAKCNYTGVELIIGGQNTGQGEFPHMAAIGWGNNKGGYDFKCAGSLISPRFVLSAGHCTYDPSARDPEPVIVRLGDQNIDSSVEDGADPIEVPIRHAIKHPDYSPPLVYNDIVLFELATDVDFSLAIRPACLWRGADIEGHTKAIATGWGVVDTRTQEQSKELQKVSLDFLENDLCDQLLVDFKSRRRWPDGFRPSQMCAGELRGGRDTCQGDSGSPLQVVSKDNQCIFHILGVTSFGKNCAESERPGVYTRVSSYVGWIESVVWPGE